MLFQREEWRCPFNRRRHYVAAVSLSDIDWENQVMHSGFKLSAILLLAAGCSAPQTGSGLYGKYDAASSSMLWVEQATTSSPLELAFIEAELGTRGEFANGSWFVGSKTASAYGKRLYSRSSGAAAGGKDCADFGSAAAAQQYFLANGGPISDPNNLDGDGDGLACEWGVKISDNSRAYRAKATTARKYSGYSSGKCYRGPRGGTYTITASGNKNYDGC
jgi:hypothetical protein